MSDNGPQFCIKKFESFLKQNGISHVKFHPQGNSIVEWMHRTLKKIISKTTDKRGNWAEVVPMALYFLRATPCTSSVFSPFLLKHGWEPITSLRLLYQGWEEDSLGKIDLEEWVLTNSERVQALKEKAVVNLKECSRIRKDIWDSKAKQRVLQMGDLVFVIKMGMNEKLTELWVGLFSIHKVNSPLSYQVDSGGHTKQTVHIQRHKRYEQRPESASVKRVTTVLEPNTDNNTMDSTYSEVVLSGQVQVANRETDIHDWVEKYADILTKQPGLTDKATFSIETGEAKPIVQRPYNTPIALMASVDKELDGYWTTGTIRQSESLWASPMVTVRKPMEQQESV